jgi:hypothetical protein
MKSHLEMKVQQNNHLSITRLKERILDVVVQDIYLVAPYRRVPKSI